MGWARVWLAWTATCQQLLHQAALLGAEGFGVLCQAFHFNVLGVQHGRDLLLHGKRGKEDFGLLDGVQRQPEADNAVCQSAELPSHSLMAHGLGDKRAVAYAVARAGDREVVAADEVIDVLRDERGLGDLFRCFGVLGEY
jgi:hypothetical protein